MGLCFRKSITVLPGVKLNLSKSGVSASFGKKGIRQTISSTGRSTTTVGIPGTGVYYRKTANVKKIAKGIGDKFSGKDASDDGKTKGKGKKVAAASEETSAVSAASAAAQEKEALIEESRAQIEEYEAYVDAIKSVHKATDGQIDWEALSKNEVPSDIVRGSEEYKEWTDLQKFSERILSGDIDAYFEVIDEVKPFDDLLDFGSDFEIGTDRPDVLEVEFRVKSEDTVPNMEYSLLASGAIKEKEMSRTNYYALMQDYICSTMIRIARDAFALLPVNDVYVHAADKALNTATGHEEEITLVSAVFDREKLMSLNMELIDPSDAVEGFRHNMKFVKTTGFKPVDRILPVEA